MNKVSRHELKKVTKIAIYWHYMHADTFESSSHHLTKCQDLAVAYFPLQRDKEETFRNSGPCVDLGVKKILYMRNLPYSFYLLSN